LTQKLRAIIKASVQTSTLIDAKATDPTGRLNFKKLADTLRSMTSVPSLADTDKLIEQTDIGADEIAPYLGFKAGNYSRHRVMKNEFVEMLVLCWKPGQRCGLRSRRHSLGDDV
jgi:hypothetical protein